MKYYGLMSSGVGADEPESCPDAGLFVYGGTLIGSGEWGELFFCVTFWKNSEGTWGVGFLSLFQLVSVLQDWAQQWGVKPAQSLRIFNQEALGFLWGEWFHSSLDRPTCKKNSWEKTSPKFNSKERCGSNGNGYQCWVRDGETGGATSNRDFVSFQFLSLQLSLLVACVQFTLRLWRHLKHLRLGEKIIPYSFLFWGKSQW